jgi:hypothetical protein
VRSARARQTRDRRGLPNVGVSVGRGTTEWKARSTGYLLRSFEVVDGRLDRFETMYDEGKRTQTVSFVQVKVSDRDHVKSSNHVASSDLDRTCRVKDLLTGVVEVSFSPIFRTSQRTA